MTTGTETKIAVLNEHILAMPSNDIVEPSIFHDAGGPQHARIFVFIAMQFNNSTQ